MYRPMCLLKACVIIVLKAESIFKANESHQFLFDTDLLILYFSTVTRALAPQSEKLFCSNRTSLSKKKRKKKQPKTL